MTMTMMIMRKLILKMEIFQNCSENYGKSALCLSGGACFAYTHFGIAKALLDQNLLPQIISGTSGGGLIAHYCYVLRTNEELKIISTSIS